MATQGPFYPGTVTTASAAPESANDWLTPSNIAADDGSEAQITAATFDSPDISFQLIAANFGFTIPTDAASIDGITVEIDRRSIIASSGVDNRVQLRDASGTLVGANKATATVWPSSTAVATYGGAADTWTASPTVAMVNDPDFGVVLSAKANIANADIGVDFIRVTVTYTENTSPTLVISDGAHAHTADNLALTQVHVLTVQDSSHGHVADNVVLEEISGSTDLVIQDGAHPHTADNLALVQRVHYTWSDPDDATTSGGATDLVIQDAAHAHAADNLVLTQVHNLAVADALHAHTADNLALTQAHVLTVQDALHAHTADSFALTQVHNLVVAEALHGHLADNIVLGVGGIDLVVADALHAHVADGLVLTQVHVLTIANASHAHAAEVLTFVLEPPTIITHEGPKAGGSPTGSILIVAHDGPEPAGVPAGDVLVVAHDGPNAGGAASGDVDIATKDGPESAGTPSGDLLIVSR
jgi:hypothetical protein